MIIISACLAGTPCRYDGSAFTTEFTPLLERLAASGLALTVCPEVLAGLATPRASCEIISGRVRTREGLDLTDRFIFGCAAALERISAHGTPDLAILKSRSPSCGSTSIYDGTFSGTLIPGSGLFAQMLRRAYPALPIIDETMLPDQQGMLLSLRT